MFDFELKIGLKFIFAQNSLSLQEDEERKITTEQHRIFKYYSYVE